jgi:type III pantothenate kinase
MHLIIDAGNTLIKLNVINNNEVVYNQAIDELQPQSILHLLKTYSVNSAILASTRALTINDFQPWWPTHIPLLEFDNQLSIPIGINYQTPETLAVIELQARVAAWQLFNKQHSLVISLGTAITVDYISDNGYFEGGTISPGMNLRFKSLHAFTGKLPLVEPGLNTD